MEKQDAFFYEQGKDITEDHIRNTLLMILHGYGRVCLNRGQLFVKMPFSVSFDRYQHAIEMLERSGEIIIVRNEENTDLLLDQIKIKKHKSFRLFCSLFSFIARLLHIRRR